jgi:hypothetical protein
MLQNLTYVVVILTRLLKGQQRVDCQVSLYELTCISSFAIVQCGCVEDLKLVRNIMFRDRSSLPYGKFELTNIID